MNTTTNAQATISNANIGILVHTQVTDFANGGTSTFDTKKFATVAEALAFVTEFYAKHGIA